MRKIAFAAAALAAAAAVPAFAQPAPNARARALQPVTRAEVQARVQARFARADANRDGFVTQDEVRAARGAGRDMMPPRREGLQGDREGRRAAIFARLDSNRDGVLSREE